MKRGAKLGILVIALAAMLGIWGLINLTTAKKEAADAALVIESDEIDIAVGEYDAVTAISWTYSDSTVSLVYDEDAEEWVNADDATCPINQDEVVALITAVSSTVASQQLEDVDDFEQYGLDDPTITVTATAGDNTVTYAVGDVSSITGEYYVQLDGGTTVYTESGLLAGAFKVQVDDLLQLESAPSDIATVLSLTVETDVTTYTIEYVEDATEIYYTDAYTWFLTAISGEEETATEADSDASGEVEATSAIEVTALDADSAADLYALVSGISFLSCETWNAEDLSDYGLDNPQGIATLTYEDSEGEVQTFTVEFGSYTSGYVYVRLAGSGMVYLATGSVLDGLMYPDWTSMTPMTLLPLDLDTVTDIIVTLDGDYVYEIARSYTIEYIEVEVEADEDEDAEEAGEGEDEEGAEVASELVAARDSGSARSDKSLDADDMDDWLDDVYSLTAASLADTTEGRAEVMTITFQRDSDVGSELTVTFWKYSSTQYLCQLNGETYFLISSSTVDNLYDDFVSIVTAEEEADEADAEAEE